MGRRPLFQFFTRPMPDGLRRTSCAFSSTCVIVSMHDIRTALKRERRLVYLFRQIVRSPIELVHPRRVFFSKQNTCFVWMMLPARSQRPAHIQPEKKENKKNQNKTHQSVCGIAHSSQRQEQSHTFGSRNQSKHLISRVVFVCGIGGVIHLSRLCPTRRASSGETRREAEVFGRRRDSLCWRLRSFYIEKYYSMGGLNGPPL